MTGTPISQAPPARLVGCPQAGERKCGRCRGAGLINRRVPQYPGYPMCGACDGTGVVPESKGRSRASRQISTQEGANGAA